MTVATSNGLAGLAGRLTDPEDRERYAAIVSYLQALPPEDEFRHLAELLGFLSLLGQRVPDALAEFLAELREQTKAVATYCAKVDDRLTRLPNEIAAGVDPAAIASEMSESFRQQLNRTGLQDTAALLKAATATIKALSAEIAATLKPATREYSGIASSIASETAKLLVVAHQVEDHNERLIFQQRSNRWALQLVGALLLLLVGGICGVVLEKHQTTEILNTVVSQKERVQPVAVPVPEVRKKSRKQSGL